MSGCEPVGNYCWQPPAPAVSSCNLGTSPGWIASVGVSCGCLALCAYQGLERCRPVEALHSCRKKQCYGCISVHHFSWRACLLMFQVRITPWSDAHCWSAALAGSCLRCPYEHQLNSSWCCGGQPQLAMWGFSVAACHCRALHNQHGSGYGIVETVQEE